MDTVAAGRGCEGGQQLTPAAADVDDPPQALPLDQPQQRVREELTGRAVRRGREVPGRPLRATVEPPSP
ncbi:hypothetical protein [Janibacter sp. DB-40]|uniref:hypothetical protein n=1 Tax=Janibacter sp. DB-40 TaxID=3028808 RepID=UPI002406C251|nr:hypothetical protein [Janibacter sp. DB-40]